MLETLQKKLRSSGLPPGYLVLGPNGASPPAIERCCRLIEKLLPSEISVPERANLYIQVWRPYLATALNEGAISAQEPNGKPMAADVLGQLASRAPLQEAYSSSSAASWALLQACWSLLTPKARASLQLLSQQLQSIQDLADSPDMDSLYAQAQNSPALSSPAPPKVRPRH